ncbi:MAG: DUF3472 domain-containing protein [Fuerstiella sp.]
MKLQVFLTLAVCLCLPQRVDSAEIHVSAATAYLDPDHNAARISADNGITRWTGPETSVTWFGQLQTTGTLKASVVLRLRPETASRLKLSIGEQSREITVRGHATDTITADFGTFQINKSGYHSFKLQSLNASGQDNGSVQELVLVGPPVEDVHFNLNSRRNAASVHLSYPVPRDTKVSAFYCEMTGLEDPLWSYYMACGWHRGYFGMQVNSSTERRIIFSVWDSGNEGIDRDKVADEDRVVLVKKGDNVFSGSFGNEGTGGHSHLKFPWKTGEKQRFLVTAEPVDKTHTIFAGYYFRPDTKEWMLISSWKAPKEGRHLRGLYSFSENFVGRNGHVVRRALYGNQWIRDSAGNWSEITTAKFSHDATGKADRRDRFMGVEDGQFFLSHGGFIDGFTEFGTPFKRPATGQSPAAMKLPPLPQ